MIYQFTLLTGLVLANNAIANETTNMTDSLIIAAINAHKGLFKVRELHEMGPSGVQEIDYVVNCENQTIALSGFALVTEKGRLTANDQASMSGRLAFYKPVIYHDQKIANSVCNNQLSMNSSVAK